MSKHSFSDTAALFEKHVFGNYARLPMSLRDGKGAWVTDGEGNEYLDLFAGIAVSNLGYGHPAVTKALRKAAKKPWHTSNLFYVRDQARLAARIQQGGDFPGRTFFANSGAEANEAAYKLAIKRGRSIRETKTRIVAMEDSFHGRTMGALQLTGQPKYRKDFGPFPGNVDWAVFNDVASLTALMHDDVAAVILEPIQGESGVRPATDAFLRAARDLCDRHGALLIFDEVQTGCARTGTLFAFQQRPVRPDVFTLAKGLGAGLPIGAMTASESLADGLKPGDHASTFGGGPLATAVATAAFDVYADPAFLADVRRKGDLLRAELAALGKPKGLFKDIRGAGLMIGAELADGLSADAIKAKAMTKGLLLNSIHDRILRLVPPLVLTDRDIDKAIDRLARSLP